MAKEYNGELSGVDTILRNLSKRPNVQSTLILSRKDGSIIKASGSIAKNEEVSQRHKQIYGTGEASASGSTAGEQAQGSQDESNHSKAVESIDSPAHVLAESIYAFVASATALAEAVRRSESLDIAFDGRPDTGRATKEKDDLSSSQAANQMDNDVQLLRLRLKKQEVIIFPDPNYLCCVVQDLEKNPR